MATKKRAKKAESIYIDRVENGFTVEVETDNYDERKTYIEPDANSVLDRIATILAS